MKLSCEMAQDLLPLYCDGVCGRDSREAVENHLKECGKCREDLRLMERELKTDPVPPRERQIVKTAAAAWKKGKTRAFLKGCLLALLAVTVLAAGYGLFHWFSTADADNLDALARQAAGYLGYDELRIARAERRGDYLAALCEDREGNWCMCVFDRDRLFENRWYANGGKRKMETGTISSWNYGSPQGDAVLIFCGGDIPGEICWYKFQNCGVTYICPVEGGEVLDIFIIPDNSNINGYPVPLDQNQTELR